MCSLSDGSHQAQQLAELAGGRDAASGSDRAPACCPPAGPPADARLLDLPAVKYLSTHSQGQFMPCIACVKSRMRLRPIDVTFCRQAYWHRCRCSSERLISALHRDGHAPNMSCGHNPAPYPSQTMHHTAEHALSAPSQAPQPLAPFPDLSILAVQTSGPCPPARGVDMALLGRSCRASPPAPQPQFVRSLGPLRSLKSRLGARLPIRRIRVFCQVPPPSNACGPAVVEASMASAAVGWTPCETVPSLWRCSQLRSTALW